MIHDHALQIATTRHALVRSGRTFISRIILVNEYAQSPIQDTQCLKVHNVH